MAVADVFDALTSKRPYKDALPFEEAFDKILEEGGSHFDTNITTVIARRKDDIFELYSWFR